MMRYLLTTLLCLMMTLSMFAQNKKVVTRHKNGRIESVTYYTGKLPGKYVKYFENGKRQEEINYVNGSEFGWHIYYDSSGTKQSADYVLGFDAIPYEKLHDTIPGLMKVDVKSSIHCEYYKNGNIRLQGYIIHAQKIGQWLYYRPDNTIDRVEYFDCLKYSRE